MSVAARKAAIQRMEKEMREASKMLEFEYAAVLRDRIKEMRALYVYLLKSRRKSKNKPMVEEHFQCRIKSSSGARVSII